MKQIEDTTTRPPLVLFGRYGSNCHSARASENSPRFTVAETGGEARERPMKKKSSEEQQEVD